MRSSGPLRLSGYGSGRAGGWLAWLRDAERPRAEGQAAAVVPAAAAVSRRRLVLPPEHRRPRGGARDRPGPAAPRATARAGRPPVAAGKNRAPVVTARPATAPDVVLGRQLATARVGRPGHRRRTAREGRARPAAPRGPNERRVLPPPMARAGPRGRPPPMEPVEPLGPRRSKEPGGPPPTARVGRPAHLRPMAFAGPLGHPRGTERARQRAGRSATEPAGHQVGPPVTRPAGHQGARSTLGPAEPARVPPASAAMRLAARRRAQPGNARAPSAGQDRGRDLAKAGSGDQPLVLEVGPGIETGTGTRLRCVRRANGAPNGAPTGPLNAPGPADPGPRGRERSDPRPGHRERTDPAARGRERTDPAARGRERTDPGPRGRVRITRRGGVPGFRRPRAVARGTALGKTVPGRARRTRVRHGRAGPASPSRTRSPLRNSTPRRAPS
jgi:hypothetical protein